jgi:hypothetical protein
MNTVNLPRPGNLPPGKRSLDQASTRGGPHALAHRWFCLAERVLGGWGPTLRVALLVVAAGASAAAAFGLGAATGLATLVGALRLIACWQPKSHSA